MNSYHVIPQIKFQQKMCSFCCGKLGTLARLKRKMGKIYRCKNCGKIMDERNIIR